MADTSAGSSATTTRFTGRWRGVVAVALLAMAVGVLAKRPALLLAAGIGVAFAAYPHATAAPDPTVSVTRGIDPGSPSADDPVTVSTTVRNEGDRTLFDLRVVDGVPPMLPVRDGSPRLATTLRPGGEATCRYELRARPGRHRFGPATVLCRDASGAIEVQTTVAEPDAVECASRLPTVPLRARSRHRVGPLATDDGGSGIEFHSVDRYERGDPASRIDWRRFARTGELTAVSFRTERHADALICVDARPEAVLASDATEPHAVALAADAAGRIGDALFAASHRVGVATFGRPTAGGEGSEGRGRGDGFLPPGSGRDHADRFHRRLASGTTLAGSPPADGGGVASDGDGVASDGDGVASEGSGAASDGDETSHGSRATGGEVATLDRRLARVRQAIGPDTQVFLLTPLCDDVGSRIAQRFESDGVPVTVVSPDVTTDRTPGSRLVRIERSNRLTTLRNAGIPAVDWDPAEPLGAALAGVAAVERWGQ